MPVPAKFLKEGGEKIMAGSLERPDEYRHVLIAADGTVTELPPGERPAAQGPRLCDFDCRRPGLARFLFGARVRRQTACTAIGRGPCHAKIAA